MVEVEGSLWGSMHVYEDGGIGYNDKAEDSLRVAANIREASI